MGNVKNTENIKNAAKLNDVSNKRDAEKLKSIQNTENLPDKNASHKDSAAFYKVVAYMKAHWPSDVPEKWRVPLESYAELLPKVLQNLTKGSTKNRELVRVAGLSGSGKTTQLLPAVEKYFATKKQKPVLVAARQFAPYHPFYQEILEAYGETKVRAKTDEFATIMLFLTISELVKNGYDIILDVTLLDQVAEEILVSLLQINHYQFWLLLIAVSPEIVEKHLASRSWRHTKATEQEFMRATKTALEFYGATCPEMRTIIWNTYDENPIYDGPVSGANATFQKYSAETEVPSHDETALREAKIKYLLELVEE